MPYSGNNRYQLGSRQRCQVSKVQATPGVGIKFAFVQSQGHPKQMMQVSPSQDPFSWCSATHLSSPQGLQEFLGVACIDAPKPVAIAGVHGAEDQHIASILQPQGSELRSL